MDLLAVVLVLKDGDILITSVCDKTKRGRNNNLVNT